MNDLIIENGKVQTRDGREVRIYATDAGGDYPVHGARRCGDEWEPKTWTQKGAYTISTIANEYDLVPISQPKYFNVYTYKTGNLVMGIFFDDLEALAEATQRQADRRRVNAKCTQAFQYLNGGITKVEDSPNAD
jgi:hypothetical protein